MIELLKHAGMKRQPKRLEEEYAPAFGAWQNDPSPDNTGTLLKEIDPIIKQGLNYYGGGLSNSPLMRGKAKQIAIQALSTYNPETAPLRTHIMSNMQRLQRLAAHERQTVRLPERVAVSQQRLAEVEKKFTDENSRPPSDIELADRMGVSVKRMAEIRKAARALPESMVMQPTEEGGVREMGSKSISQEPDQWVEMVYMTLDPINQIILERALGLHGHQPTNFTQIAKKLRLSSAAISQRWNKIQQLLDSRDEYL